MTVWICRGCGREREEGRKSSRRVYDICGRCLNRMVATRRRLDREFGRKHLPWVCFVCRSKEGLQIHHKFRSRLWYWDKWRPGDLSNLVVLCQWCHLRYHELGNLKIVKKIVQKYGKTDTAMKKVSHLLRLKHSFSRLTDVCSGPELKEIFLRSSNQQEAEQRLRKVIRRWRGYSDLDRLNFFYSYMEILGEVDRLRIGLDTPKGIQKVWEQVLHDPTSKERGKRGRG